MNSLILIYMNSTQTLQCFNSYILYFVIYIYCGFRHCKRNYKILLEYLLFVIIFIFCVFLPIFKWIKVNICITYFVYNMWTGFHKFFLLFLWCYSPNQVSASSPLYPSQPTYNFLPPQPSHYQTILSSVSTIFNFHDVPNPLYSLYPLNFWGSALFGDGKPTRYRSTSVLRHLKPALKL